MPDIRSFYVTVLSQAFSPSEDVFAAGTSFGHINIFNVGKLYDEAIEAPPSDHCRLPFKNFKASSKPIQALASTNNCLIVGGKNCLQGFKWDMLTSAKCSSQDVKPDWTIDLQLPIDFGTKETVDVIKMGEDFSAYVACGDNKVYHVDLEYGKKITTFAGHSDFIHSMSLMGNQLATASEDGTVCIWDIRKPTKSSHKITPHTESSLSRPNLGKWIGAVAMSEDWLVCGGGPQLALYHLRSLTMSKPLLENDIHGVNTVTFHEDSIIVGVNGPFVYHCLFSGDITVKMPTTPLRVYSISLQKKGKNQLMTVGGASGDIDICVGYKLQDQTVRCLS